MGLVIMYNLLIIVIHVAIDTKFLRLIEFVPPEL